MTGSTEPGTRNPDAHTERMHFPYDSRSYWKNRARVRQSIINQISRDLKRANEKIGQLQAGE